MTSTVPLTNLEEAAIRCGCEAADVHMACSFPACTCKVVPVAVRAALGFRNRVTDQVAVETKFTDRNAFALLSRLGLTYREAAIAFAQNEWLVLLQIPITPPSLTEWEGHPVRYEHIGEIVASGRTPAYR